MSDYLHPSHMHSSALLETAETATVLITWLCSKTYILALIRAIQERKNEEKKLAIVCTVLTRWTAHYCAFQRLLVVRWALEQLVRDDRRLGERESNITMGNKDAKLKACTMCVLILDTPNFWLNLARWGHSQCIYQTQKTPWTPCTHIKHYSAHICAPGPGLDYI